MSPINYSYNSHFFFIYKDIRIHILISLIYKRIQGKEFTDENKVEHRTERRT